MLSIAERTVIGSAIEEAVTCLPEGFELRLYISAGGIGVSLNGQADDDHTNSLDFFNGWQKIGEMIRDALTAAIAAGENGRLTPHRKTRNPPPGREDETG
jgi:hypothetical protein